jgi:hypothetical protein
MKEQRVKIQLHHKIYNPFFFPSSDFAHLFFSFHHSLPSISAISLPRQKICGESNGFLAATLMVQAKGMKQKDVVNTEERVLSSVQ